MTRLSVAIFGGLVAAVVGAIVWGLIVTRAPAKGPQEPVPEER